MCSYDDAERTAILVRCENIHSVRAFVWVRKHGLGSGWRDSHARNDAILREKLIKHVLHQVIVRIRALHRTLRIQLESRSRQPGSNESVLAARLVGHAAWRHTRLAVGPGLRTGAGAPSRH